MCAEAPEFDSAGLSGGIRVRKDERLEATSEWPGRRSSSALRLAIPKRACSLACSGVTGLRRLPRQTRARMRHLLARRSAYINTTDVFGLDGRFLGPLTAHPFCVSFLARAIEAIGPNPRCCPRPRWRATPYCNGSGAGTAQSRSALSMPNQTLLAPPGSPWEG
jgi:hypothetical protein